MCAIAGFAELEYDSQTLQKMLRTMTPRGPDGKGVYLFSEGALLHTRLAIIDPEGGAQPMTVKLGIASYTITYNGELYNTAEIKQELESLGHVFQTRSDTEAVLRSYIQWGPDCLNRLNGIFAFGIWEEPENRLFLARDRMGVKPLFYTLRGKGILFASEIKTILAYPGMEARLDSDGVGELILLGPGRTPGSGVLKNILELEPGCCGFFQNERLKTWRYWHLTDREHSDSFEKTVETVRYLVTDAIQRQMVSDVPIGTFLSGGLDSSLISAVCAKEMVKRGEPLHTFSVGYEDNEKYFVAGKFQPNSDEHYIGVMAEYLKSQQHWTVLSPECLVEALEDATRARDLPGMADVDFSLLAFCRDIRGHVKVALSGECADEIFGGYPWYRDPEVRDRVGFPWAQNTSQRAAVLHPHYRNRISAVEFVAERYEQTLAQSDILPGTSPLERRMKQMVNLNHRWFMQTLLDRKDRMSMACGLEVRVPFCDYRIAEYLYGVPWEYKDYQGREKGLLRKAMEGLLPEEILYRKKSPYPKTWHPKYLALVRERFEKLLSRHNALIFQILDREAICELLSGPWKWPWYGQLMGLPQTIAYFLQLDHWLQEYRVELI